MKPEELVRMGCDGPVAKTSSLEKVEKCQRCDSTRLMFLVAGVYGDTRYNYGMVKGPLRSGDLPGNLKQFNDYNDLTIVFCLDCGQLQGAWPCADIPEPEQKEAKQPQTYADFAELASEPVAEVSEVLAHMLVAKGLANYVDGPSGQQELNLTSAGKDALRQEIEKAKKAVGKAPEKQVLPPGAYLLDPTDPSCEVYMIPEHPSWDLEKYNASVPAEARVALSPLELTVLTALFTVHAPEAIAAEIELPLETVEKTIEKLTPFLREPEVPFYLNPFGRAVMHSLTATAKKPLEQPPVGSYVRKDSGQVIRPESPEWNFLDYLDSLELPDRFGVDQHMLNGLRNMGGGTCTRDEVREAFGYSKGSVEHLINDVLLRHKLIEDYAGRFIVSALGCAVISRLGNIGGSLAASKAKPALDPSKPLDLSGLVNRERLALKALYLASDKKALEYRTVRQILDYSKNGRTTLRKALMHLALHQLVGRCRLVKEKAGPRGGFYALTPTGVRAAKELIG